MTSRASTAWWVRPSRRAMTLRFEVGLVHDLRSSESWIPELALVALIDNDVVGYCTTTRASVSGEPVLALGPIGIAPEYQNGGIGRALMESTVDRALSRDEVLIGLLGDPGYYARFGFVPGASLGVTPPVSLWGDAFQILVLGNGSTPSGTFIYPTAFDV